MDDGGLILFILGNKGYISAVPLYSYIVYIVFSLAVVAVAAVIKSRMSAVLGGCGAQPLDALYFPQHTVVQGNLSFAIPDGVHHGMMMILPSNPMLNLIYGTDTTRIIVVTAMVTTEPMVQGKMIMMILNVTVGNPMTQTPAPVRVG